MARRRSSKNSGSGGCLGVLILVSLAVYLFQTYWQVILAVAGIAFLIWGIARLAQNRNAAADNNDTQNQYTAPAPAPANPNRTVAASVENRSPSTSTASQSSNIDSRNVSHEVDRQIREMFARRRDLSGKIDKAQKAIWKLNKSIGRNSEEKTKQRDELVEGKELLEGRLNAAVYTFKEASTRDFAELRSALDALANSSARTHDSTPACRTLITPYNPIGDMKYILYAANPICMTIGTDLLCIVPGYLVRFRKDGTYVTTYTCKALNASLITGSYDEQVTQTRWLYAKQDGGRDMRYSNNRLISYNTTRTHTVPNMLFIEAAEAQYRYESDYPVRNKVVAAVKTYAAVEPTKVYDPAYHVLRLLEACDTNNPNLRKLHRIVDGDEINLNYDIEDEEDRQASSSSAAYGSDRYTEELQKPSKAKRFWKGVLKVFVAGAAIATAATFAPTIIEKIEELKTPTTTEAPALAPTIKENYSATAVPSSTPTATTEQSDSYTLKRLGDNYYAGQGVEQSYERAFEYYKRAADLGNTTAQFNVGYMYENGEGVTQSSEKAAEYYQLAADQGDADAQINLGSLYENGTGVEQSYEKAFEYYRLAADQGEAVAYTNLARLYFDGNGVEQSYEKALEYFQAAADLGNDQALYIVGLMYQNGLGTEQSNDKAREIFQQAADMGNEKAEAALEEMDASSEEEAHSAAPTAEPTPEPTTEPTPEPTREPISAATLRGASGFEYTTGSRGDAMRYIQQMLINQSYLPAGQADGVFGPKTETAVMTFQESNGLPVTGVVDLATQFKLAELESGFETIEGQDYEYAGLQRYGVYKFDDGVFIGIVRSDRSYQEGTLYYEDGSSYAGPFKNNQRNGKGEAWFSNGDYYVGNWKDDKMNGKGIYHFGSPDSTEQYDGEWVDGKMSGKGTYTFADGTTVKAIWEDNQQIGWWK